MYPEVFGGDYGQYALWLTQQGIVDYHIRDQFSSGGQEPIRLSNGEIAIFPGVFRRVKMNMPRFLILLSRKNESGVIENPAAQGTELRNRIYSWLDTVVNYFDEEYDTIRDALSTMILGSPGEDIVDLRTLITNSMTITCRHCMKRYKQILKRNFPGRQFINLDTCPYCHQVNGESTEYWFQNITL